MGGRVEKRFIGENGVIGVKSVPPMGPYGVLIGKSFVIWMESPIFTIT
jgi:hypothetical protein